MSFFGPAYNYKTIDPNHFLDKFKEDPTAGILMGRGKAGRSAGRIIDNLDSGEDLSRSLSSDYAAIDADAGQQRKQIQNNVNQRLAYGGPAGSVAAAGVIADADNDLAQRTMEAKAGVGRDLRRTAYDTFQHAYDTQSNNRNTAAQLREQQRRDAAEAEKALTFGANGGSTFGALLRGGLRAGAAYATGGGSELARAGAGLAAAAG